MNIVKQYLTVSNYNRPGTKRGSTTAVACHYIGNPGTSAQANRNYFENLSKTHSTKASAHYIIGLQGEIIQMILTQPTHTPLALRHAIQTAPADSRQPPTQPTWSCVQISAGAGDWTRCMGDSSGTMM